MTKNTAKWREVTDQGDLCLTGDGLVHLQSIFNKDDLNFLLAKVRVFARFDPKQKEFVITSLRDAGFYVLMCGDGTNDVGALKHAHVGVAILSSQPGAEKNKESKVRRSSGLCLILWIGLTCWVLTIFLMSFYYYIKIPVSSLKCTVFKNLFSNKDFMPKIS